MKPITNFIDEHFQHFNSLALKNAAQGWQELILHDGRVIVTLAGALSTAGIGKSLAALIRKKKAHAICCTGANLEEDLYRLIGYDRYVPIPNYRTLTAIDELSYQAKGLNRVTDVAIPESILLEIDKALLTAWAEAEQKEERLFPHEFFFKMFDQDLLSSFSKAQSEDSWVRAAWENNIPVYVPGWEDSSSANSLVAEVINGNLKSFNFVKTGLEYMQELVRWYQNNSVKHEMGFVQLGGGISGDFPICVVPLIRQDLKGNLPYWNYFCQISDGHESFGSYSQARPEEKITWGKLSAASSRHRIESDATICFPLMASYVLEI